MDELLALMTQKPEVAIAVASTVIAALALVASVASIWVAHLSLKHQQRHNVLSLQPLPYIVLGNYEHHLYVRVRNDGHGPMIVRRIQITDGKESRDALIEWMPELPDGMPWTTYIGPVCDRSVPSDGILKLVELRGDIDEPSFERARELVRTALGPLEVRVEYTDVYATEFAPCTRKLDWFVTSSAYPDAQQWERLRA